MLKKQLLLIITLCLFATLFVTTAAAADDRAEDRKAIRDHIDRIFRAFINKDNAELRATHDQNWLGYLEGSRTMIRGVDQYMKATGNLTPGPYGMKSYKMREFDIIFHGDAAFVGFVADVDAATPDGIFTRALRITDFYTKKDGAWIQTGSDTQLHPESIGKQYQSFRTLRDGDRKKLLEAREAVWRAFFANDQATLRKLLPEEALTSSAGQSGFEKLPAILDGAKRFAGSGMKLAKLEFPSTQLQVYGYTAVVYSTYRYELEGPDGKRSSHQGLVTEIFVNQDGEWKNPGSHMEQLPMLK